MEGDLDAKHLANEGKTQSKESEDHTIIQEGKASIIFSKGNEVFYNPVQEVNRDLSIAIIKLFQEDWTKEQQEPIKTPHRKKKKEEENEIHQPNRDFMILEALSATGLRSIRYAKEIVGIKNIVANDIDRAAVEAIKKNVEYNQIEPSLITPNHADASILMYQHRSPEKRFTVVDIDPYGGASPFLDSAVQSVDEGGLLCVTCTDMAVLCGNNSEVCWTKYNSLSLHGRYCHEMVIHLPKLLKSSGHSNCIGIPRKPCIKVSLSAGIITPWIRYKRYIVPLISLNIDFYVRVFVRVYTSPNETKKSATKVSQVYQCTGCDSFWLQPLCKATETKNGNYKYTPAMLTIDGTKCNQCGRGLKIGGPIWNKPMHNPSLVDRALAHFEQFNQNYNQSKKILGMLNAVKDEVHEVPLYYTLNSLANTLHVTTPSMLQFRSAVLNKGFKISNAHCNPNAVKTTAPNDIIWDIMKCWSKLHPSKNRSPNSPGATIISKPSAFEADFTIHQDADNKKVPKFHPNPAYWGPGSRAGGKKRSNTNFHSGEPIEKKRKSKDEENEEWTEEGEQDAPNE